MATDTMTNLIINAMAQYLAGKGVATPSLALGLFVNNWAFSASTILADLVECSAPGYARASLAAASWSGSTVGGVATYTYPNVTFTFTGSGGGQIIYGNFYYDSGNGDVVWGQTWASSYTIPAGGGAVILTPQIVTKQC
jgi:hypothetical protein